ncbi:MAG TPA: enolase C-terminal domain-like protein [Chloroflexota bacterium]|jgi:mannonate dehydratase|nr:enolase C-terminal domain-like protein [Chloroflexota bacterium]
MPKITAVRCIRTRATGTWVIVKILTDQPGLYGIGSAHEYNVTGAVVAAIEEWFAPRLIGREASHIEDIWQSTFTSGYWRTGPTLNAALGGIDVALWDIKGKEAGMPLYQLLGGPCRTAVPCYAHASGNTLPELEDDVRRYLEDGWQYVRCQLGPYGGGGFLPAERAGFPRNVSPQQTRAFDDETYVETITAMFAHLRDKLGFAPKLTHDVHEHLRPHMAVTLAKLLEPYRLFFLEDALPPEHLAYYRLIRQQCTTPQAVGELFTNVQEWLPLISERLIDFIRVRVSKAGGITPAQKIAHLCEWFGVHTAWQEGGNTDPVNQTAALHLDLASWNFGIQEENHFRPEELEAFPGHPVLERGYLYANDQPGLGIDIDEAKAAKLLDPERARRPRYVAEDRRADGTVVRP